MTNSVNINSNLLVSQRLPNGDYNWTLPYRLCDMLHMAEDLCGPRDTSYTILHIEPGHKKPQIWFPSEEYPKHIVIRLKTDPAEDMFQACYQLAHETVHLLAPVKGKANNLEEGVATYFAAYYMKIRMKEPCWRPSDTPSGKSYKKVLEKVLPLFDRDEKCISKIRKNQKFSQISKDRIRQAFPNSPSREELNWLFEEFVRE